MEFDGQFWLRRYIFIQAEEMNEKLNLQNKWCISKQLHLKKQKTAS